MNKLSPKNTRFNKSNEFSAEHFESFNTLEYEQKSRLLTSISLDLFATACCLITDHHYLQKLFTFLDGQQSQFLLAAINKKQLLKPSPIFITRVQKMIIYLHTMFSEVIFDVDEFTHTANIELDELELEEDFETTDTEFSGFTMETKALCCEQTLLDKMTIASKKDQAKYQAVLDAGVFKRLYYPQKSYLHKLDELAQAFPNFIKVISLIRSSIQISLLGGTPLSLPIINLQGKPGCGKTYFVKALANTLKLEFFTLNVASMSGRLELVGGNKQYGDADIGAIGQIMCLEAKTFQPLILIDELCMARDNSNDSVIPPLYSLFDREQRKSFREHYVDIDLDLSGALFISTTNNFDKLKPALKSRLVNIEIKPPTQKQMHGIVATIYKDSLLEVALMPYFKAELSPTVLSLLAQKPPRVAKEAIRLAIGQACERAVKHTKIQLEIKDFNAAKFEREKPSLSRLKKVDILH